MSDKVFLVSFKKKINGVKKWNDIVHLSEKQFKLKGFSVKKIEGYNLAEHKEIKRNHIVYRNVLDKTLNKAKKYLKENNKANGFYIAEDDAYINLSLSELKTRVKKSGYSLSNKNGPILRIGYQKILKDNRFPRGYFCVGAQLLWIPKNILEDFTNSMKNNTFKSSLKKNKVTKITVGGVKKKKESMEKTKAQHFNGFLTKNMDLKIELIPQTKNNKIVDELQHESLTLGGKVRPGRVISSLTKNTKNTLKRNTKKGRFLNRINKTIKNSIMFR